MTIPPEAIISAKGQIDSWLAANLDQFDPFSWETPGEAEIRRKSFNELCLYLYVNEFVYGTRAYLA